MAEIDSNGPTIEVGIDMERVQSDAGKMQMTLAEAVKSIDAQVNKMQDNFQNALKEISVLPDKMASGMADVLRVRDDEKRQKEDLERKQQEERRRIVDFETKRRETGKAVLEQNKKIVASFRNMALAASTVVTAGMGIREMLNFTNDLARMDLAIKTFGMNAERFFQVRNLMREGGIQDSETFAMEDTMSHAFRTARERGGMGLLNEGQIIALNKLSNYRPNLNPLTARNEDGSRMNFAQWQKEMMIAMSKFYHDKSISLSKEMRIEIMSEFTKSKLIAQHIAELTPEQIAREDEKARREAANLQKNRENNAKVQELKTSLETNVVDLLAKMSPEITSIIESINKFADNPENVKLLAQGLRDLGGVILQLLNKVLHWFQFFGVKVPQNLLDLTGEQPQLKKGEMLKERQQELSKKLGVDIYDYSGKLWATDNKNNTVPLTDPNESAESLRTRLAEKQAKKDAAPSLGELLFPSAHAETISYQPNSSGRKWTAGAGASVQTKQKHLEELEQQYGLPKGSLDAQWSQESGRGKYMLSPAGAKGDFGFMPDTAREYGVDVKDFHSSAQGAAKYMKVLLNKYHGDIDKARAAYNWGMGNVDKVSRQYGADWLSHAPRETRNYVSEVRKNAYLYKNHLLPNRINSQQMQTQTQAQKIINARTANSGDSNYNVNIHVNNGNPQHIAQAFEQKVRQIQRQNKESEIKFMNPDPLNGISGIS
ncbi:Soluble lytic murein transglycosylase or regulatory protein s (may contain LysM/invasin domain) (MltE) (PDB:153L) [Commensalibacter communis]|uniref:Soluble lytic murein transglycosylase or regulatory protein s ( may contain LysM/invasin domain) (MltE) n=1 Tax=Commensalibacter communis TaxID=2972786 RepID=A0A9W4XAR0_9PROT|nr:lytic transglycosylase domain-containing protein [Commensalibacter communis]CAI3941689.1 Soluble lytic murein transglycosylase or regulatory protein s (may contain LysM/invasin domain) (MltE) (PDB:153L) [Commensalibacter communis]CAI3944935.1 Soluble lytic murein transglycosylase or regulatory protein s (may contain LysM/invasin domain) (MltE) (PDB:153L) [Commensalibacter communis]CAI3959125.1 Soluble lytic murein transglycosylase or regulatory protein s (may contain LysM/invasin domain) (Mlt